MADELKGKRIAFLMANEGVEQVELTEPRKAIEEAGAHVDVIVAGGRQIQAFNHLDKADRFDVDKTVVDAKAADYDALVLPGGVANPDVLRMDEDAVRSCGSSSRRASRSPRSAMRRGRSSRRAW